MRAIVLQDAGCATEGEAGQAPVGTAVVCYSGSGRFLAALPVADFTLGCERVIDRSSTGGFLP